MDPINRAKMSSAALEILVVEDHPDTLKYLRMYLEQSGHSVRTAETMAEALEKLSEEPGDMLLSDIGLPDGLGWSLIKTAHLPPSVYAIAISGFGVGNDRARSREAGFRHHLTKPFTPDLLDQFLEEASRERAQRGTQSQAA
jgi:DNA-binding response OmpR family regulator